jgi:hypothetical protein
MGIQPPTDSGTRDRDRPERHTFHKSRQLARLALVDLQEYKQTRHTEIYERLAARLSFGCAEGNGELASPQGSLE